MLAPDDDARMRQRWGLPQDYPIIAPAHAGERSELAKAIGLGKHIRT